MEIFKELGSLVGTVAGAVVGGAVAVVGQVTDSQVMKEIGEEVYKSSISAGHLIGQAADGVADVVGGMISQNQKAVDQGIEELGDITSKVVVGAISGVGNMAYHTLDVVEGVVERDKQKTVEAGKNFVKVAVVSALTIGACNDLDGEEKERQGVQIIIKNARVFTEQGTFEKKDIFIKEGYFIEENPSVQDDVEQEVIDAEGLIAIPGLTDLHFHGCMGYDFCDGTWEAFEAIATYQAQQGVLVFALRR